MLKVIDSIFRFKNINKNVKLLFSNHKFVLFYRFPIYLNLFNLITTEKKISSKLFIKNLLFIYDFFSF